MIIMINGNKIVKNKKEIKFLIFLFFLVFMINGFLISTYSNGEWHQKSEQENGPGVYKPVEGGQAQTLTPDTSGNLQQNNVATTPLNNTENSQTSNNNQNNVATPLNNTENSQTSNNNQNNTQQSFKSGLLVFFIALSFLFIYYLVKKKKI